MISKERQLRYKEERDCAELMENLRRFQQNHCYGCSSTDLIVDHCHRSGLIRGYLCGSCNTREGYKSPVFDGYRDNPPTLQLGIKLYYVDSSGYIPHRYLFRDSCCALCRHIPKENVS